MRETILTLGAAALLLAAVPGFAEAQEVEPRYFGAGWTLGPTYVTNLNEGVAEGARELDPGVGLIGAVHVDRWIGQERRFGLRLQGSYEQPRFEWSPGERKIDTAALDLSVLVRLMTPDDDAIMPYLAAGLGGVWYNLGTGQPTTFPSADAYHDGESRLMPTGNVGLGVDLPIGWEWHRLPVKLRIEAADHVTFQSPLWAVTDDSRHGAVHHIRFTMGMHTTLRRW